MIKPMAAAFEACYDHVWAIGIMLWVLFALSNFVWVLSEFEGNSGTYNSTLDALSFAWPILSGSLFLAIGWYYIRRPFWLMAIDQALFVAPTTEDEKVKLWRKLRRIDPN